jgi:PTH1 family peptidyl-tRNA hydrolase
MLFVIAGLGNPGARYARTRHNCGYLVLEALAARQGWLWSPAGRFDADEAEGLVDGRRVLLLRAHSYMNLSGPALAPVVRYLKVPLDSFLVVHDDLDLAPGRIQLRRDGGFGGHRGLESIGQQLGSADFGRLRVGIGRPPPGQEAADYVLEDFTEPEARVMEEVFQRAGEALICWVSQGMEAAMNRFNNRREIRA